MVLENEAEEDDAGGGRGCFQDQEMGRWVPDDCYCCGIGSGSVGCGLVVSCCQPVVGGGREQSERTDQRLVISPASFMMT